MSRTTLYIVIALMSIALMGIIGLQAYWLRQAMVINNRNFNAAVNDALDQVALRLEQEEMDQQIQ